MHEFAWPAGTATGSILLLLGSSFAYWNARRAADTAYDRSLLSSARAIAERLYDEQGELSVEVPYIALDNFAYDITGRLYYQVLDLQGRSVSGYEDLPGPNEDVPMTQDYPALAFLRCRLPQYGGAPGQPVATDQRRQQPRHGGNPRGRNTGSARAYGA